MEELLYDALDDAISDIKESVGLTIVPNEDWMSLCREDGGLLARVPRSDDPMDDIDTLRTYWFRTARNMSNTEWD